MLIVKVTIFLIVITIIFRFIVASMISTESLSARIDMTINNKYPAYVYVLGVLVAIDIVGIICSVYWFLFMR